MPPFLLNRKHASTFPSHGAAHMCYALTTPEVHWSIKRNCAGILVRSEQTHCGAQPASSLKRWDCVQS